MANVKLWRPAIAKLLNKEKHTMTLFEYEVAHATKRTKSYRFDAISFNPFRVTDNSIIRGLETKSSRADFESDKKWENYLPYCHYFAFMCETGVIKPEELPKGVGLFYVHEDGSIGKYKEWNKREVDTKYRSIVAKRLYSRAVADLYKQSQKTQVVI